MPWALFLKGVTFEVTEGGWHERKSIKGQREKRPMQSGALRSNWDKGSVEQAGVM